MMRMDRAIGNLKWAQQRLKDAHFEACQALAEFDAMDADQSLPVDTRIAARSLKQETLVYCGLMLQAMQQIPEAALPKPETEPQAASLKPKVSLPCIRTAKSPLDEFKAKKRGPVATSARNGKPILVAMTIVLLSVLSYPLSVHADTCHLTPETSRSIERVIDALIQIESSGRPAVTGDGGRAVGLLQIWPVTIREANRIAGSNHWKLSDRLCPAKSRAIARTILVWHVRRGCTDQVELACKWNRPFGDADPQYRAKAVAALSEI